MPWTTEGSRRAAREQRACPECGRMLRSSNMDRHLAAGHVAVPRPDLERLARGWRSFLRGDGAAGFDSLAEAVLRVLGARRT